MSDERGDPESTAYKKADPDAKANMADPQWEKALNTEEFFFSQFEKWNSLSSEKKDSVLVLKRFHPTAYERARKRFEEEKKKNAATPTA